MQLALRASNPQFTSEIQLVGRQLDVKLEVAGQLDAADSSTKLLARIHGIL